MEGRKIILFCLVHREIREFLKLIYFYTLIIVKLWTIYLKIFKPIPPLKSPGIDEEPKLNGYEFCLPSKKNWTNQEKFIPPYIWFGLFSFFELPNIDMCNVHILQRK